MRRILITGGTRGIGRACVELLSQTTGHLVDVNEIVFTYNTQKEVADELVASCGRHVRAIHLNLLDEAAATAAIAAEISARGNFDAVVHNAAVTADSVLYFMDARQWHDVINVSLNSFFVLNKAVIPHMVGQRWGRIVAIASIAGEAGNRGQTNYAAAKGALIAATKSLAREVAGKGIVANVVSPGYITTEMTKEISEKELKTQIPVGRFGKPAEVANVVAFLLSNQASYVNGAVVRVNGGLYT